MATAVFGLLFLQFAVVAAANGLVYLPGRHSEVMLSGLPTLLIALASLCLSAACALYIIDHHDKRPNEALYRTARRTLGALAVGLYIAAPGLEHLAPAWAGSMSWHLNWFDLRPDTVRSWLVGYPPEWRPGWVTVSALLACLVVPGLMTKWVPALATSRLMLGVAGLALVGLGACWQLELLFDIATGHLTTAHRHAGTPWSPTDPARFQAVAATLFHLAVLTWSTGLLLIMGAALPALKSTAESA